MKGKQPHLDTKLIHAGEPKPLIGGAVSMPIFQSSTFAAEGEPGYYNLKYIRLNNTPNHIALHQKPAATENAETALVTASGMAVRTISSPRICRHVAFPLTLSMAAPPSPGSQNVAPIHGPYAGRGVAGRFRWYDEF